MYIIYKEQFLNFLFFNLKVKNTINEKDPTRAAQIERALLEALDRVQTAWLNQDPSQSANKSSLLNSSKYFSDFILFHPIIIFYFCQTRLLRNLLYTAAYQPKVYSFLI